MPRYVLVLTTATNSDFIKVGLYDGVKDYCSKSTALDLNFVCIQLLQASYDAQTWGKGNWRNGLGAVAA